METFVHIRVTDEQNLYLLLTNQITVHDVTTMIQGMLEYILSGFGPIWLGGGAYMVQKK